MNMLHAAQSTKYEVEKQHCNKIGDDDKDKQLSLVGVVSETMIVALSNDVLRSILQFVNEVELYVMEDTYPDTINTHVSGPQWNYLNQRDVARGTNRRWRQQLDYKPIQQQQQQEQTDHHHTDPVTADRYRGREYAQSLIFVRNRADEARHYFDFDRDCVSADEIPVHNNDDKEEDDDVGDHYNSDSIIMPLDYWREWIHFDDVLTEYNNNDDGQGVGDNTLNENIRIIDLFLELSFSRGSKNKDDSDTGRSCWWGFRKARLERQQDYNSNSNNNNKNNYMTANFTMSLKLELDSLVKEMGWTEIKEFRDESQDYRLCHFDVSNTQEKMKSLMTNMQLTIVHVASGRLLIATGGYASPDTTHRRDSNIFTIDANVARFHCRHDRYPIVETTTTTTTTTMQHHPFRFSFLRIPTISNTDQSMEIIIKTQ
jgi:hypothetical protein